MLWELIVCSLFNDAFSVTDYITRVGTLVANNQKWRIGHESVATCQAKELSNFALNFLFFFSRTNLFHYLHRMAVVSE
jgi:hypothetical protein